MKRKTNLGKNIALLVTLMAVTMLVGAGSVAAQIEAPESEAQVQTTTAQTVYEVIQAEPSLSSFEALIDAAALSDNLQQDGPFTIFAPTNEAWALFNASAAPDTSMTDVLLYHVLNGEYFSADLAERWAVMTLSGNYLFFEATEGKAETGIRLNESANVVGADIEASNGVVHIIDAVVPSPEENSLFASTEGSPEIPISEVLENDGRFDTLLSLLEQAGLRDQLDNAGATYTLFAPTDDAFAQVPEEMMEAWLSDPEGALNTILSYHIVYDRLSINQIANDDYLPTLEGRPLVVTIDEDVRVYLNGRPVQSFNLLASNGVIHVVDEVILP